MDNQGNTEKYISQTLGLSCEQKDEIRYSLPLYLKGRFRKRLVSVEGTDFLLLYPQAKLQMSASVVCSSAESIRKHTSQNTIVVLDEVTAESRRTFISKKENFIVPGRQLYIPQLGILFQERGMRQGEKKESDTFSPAAQRLILFHLQAQSLNGLSLVNISGLLGYPPKTITQIAKELKEKGLCVTMTSDAKSKYIEFADEGMVLWNKAYPFFQNPIKAVRYVDDINAVSGIECAYTGDQALTHYTFIANNGRLSRGLYWRSEITKSLELREQEGTVRLELWKYPPIIIEGSGFVDPLSLALCYKDDSDERVMDEIHKLIYRTLEK